MDAFQRVILDRGENVRPFLDGPEVKAVDREIVRAEFYRCWPSDGATEKQRAEAKRKRFNSGEKDARTKGKIATGEIGTRDLVWALYENRRDEPFKAGPAGR